MSRVYRTMALAGAMLLLPGCGYNTLQSTDEQIKASWAEVVNQYQRRADLVPNLVNTVKGFAAQEQQVLLGVTNARAGRRDPSHTRAHQRSRRVRKVSGGARAALLRAFATAGRRRALSPAQVGRQFSRSAGAARGHGEPDRRRTQPLHQGGAAVQHSGAAVSEQPHRDGVRL